MVKAGHQKNTQYIEEGMLEEWHHAVRTSMRTSRLVLRRALPRAGMLAANSLIDAL